METEKLPTKRLLIEKLNNYIGHSFHIWENSNSPLKDEKLGIITLINSHAKSINSENSLKLICEEILKIKKQLIQILPNELNMSYESSVSILKEIINFCHFINAQIIQ